MFRICCLTRGKKVEDTGVHRYYECPKCEKRWYTTAMDGYQPLNKRWLDGGEWDDPNPPNPPRQGSGAF